MNYPEANLHTVETTSIFGKDAPAARDHAENVTNKLAEIGAELIITKHHRAPGDNPTKRARTIANALTACEQIAPKETVIIVSSLAPHDMAVAYMAAQKRREARNRKAARA